MCNQAAYMMMQGAGAAMQNRQQHQNQLRQMQAQREHLESTNQDQTRLREQERARQRDLGQRQMGQFDRALESASPERLQEEQAAQQAMRAQQMQDAAPRTSATLPGQGVPGGSGLTGQAMRVVGDNVTQRGDQMAQAQAAQAAAPAAMGRLAEALMGPRANIDMLGQAARQSAALLPGELDASFRAPILPADRQSLVGPMLQGIGQMGSMRAGVQAGQDEFQRMQQEQMLRQMFPQGLPAGGAAGMFTRG